METPLDNPNYLPSKHSLSELNIRSSPMRIDTPPTTKQTEIVLVEYSRRLSNRATSESGVHGGSCIQLGGKGSFKTPQMSIHYSLLIHKSKSYKKEWGSWDCPAVFFKLYIEPFLHPEWVKISFQLIQTGLLFSSINRSSTSTTTTTSPKARTKDPSHFTISQTP